jgi:hypothetical protein
MMAEFAKKVELRFWDIMIPVLSNSERVRKLVRGAVAVYHNEELTRKIAVIVIIACAGFASGILIFSIKSTLG